MPWGDDWEQTATLEAAVSNAYRKRSVSPNQLMPGTRAQRKQSAIEITRKMELWRKGREAAQKKAERAKRDGK